MRLFSILGLPALALVLATPAFAQLSQPLRADIPFAFHLGDDQMAAGKYEIRDMRAGVNIIHFALLNGTVLPVDKIRASIRCGVPKTAARASEPCKFAVVFNKYGNDRYFVSEIWAGEGSGVTFAKSRRERELIVSKVVAGYPVERVTITARVMDSQTVTGGF